MEDKSKSDGPIPDPANLKQFKAYYDQWVQSTIVDIRRENGSHLARLQHDASKKRAAYEQHKANPPTANENELVSEELMEWGRELKVLDQATASVESRVSILQAKVEDPDNTILDRFARTQFKETHRDSYRAYQRARQQSWLDQIIADYREAEAEFEAMNSKTSKAKYKSVCSRIMALVERAEKNPLFDTLSIELLRAFMYSRLNCAKHIPVKDTDASLIYTESALLYELNLALDGLEDTALALNKAIVEEANEEIIIKHASDLRSWILWAKDNHYYNEKVSEESQAQIKDYWDTLSKYVPTY